MPPSAWARAIAPSPPSMPTAPHLPAIEGLNAKLEEEFKAKDGRISELERRLAGIDKLLAPASARQSREANSA